MEGWKDESLHRRRNVNRGYHKLGTWQMAVDLYAFLYEKVGKFQVARIA